MELVELLNEFMVCGNVVGFDKAESVLSDFVPRHAESKVINVPERKREDCHETLSAVLMTEQKIKTNQRTRKGEEPYRYKSRKDRI